MDIPELTNFKPRASTSTFQSHTNHYADEFPLDPQLFSTNSTQQPRPDDQYWSSQGGGRDTSDEEEEDEDEDEDEDEEEEEEQQQQQGLKRRAVTSLKGKEKAINQDQDDDVSDEEAEAEDLGRFIQAIRNSNSTGVGGQTLLDKEFDRSIQQELNTTTRDNNQDDLFEDDVDLMEDLTVGVKGRKRGRRRSQRRGRRAAGDVEPSPEVQRLLFQANEHYSLGEYDQAIELLEEVIRIDPILKVTWYTLATIYEDRNQREKSIQCKIVATHLNSSSNSNLNQDWSDLGKESRDLGLLHQAIYCFTQAVKHDKGDVNSMWDRAYLLKMSGATKIAIKCFQNLLKLLPHDPGVLRELSPLLSQSRDFYPLAINLLESAFDFYQETVPIVSSETLHLLNSYGYEDLETLTDFLLLEKKYLKVVKVIKRGVRWIQGRALETEWDSYLELDDREFDLKRKERKGWEKLGNSWLEREPVYELDVRLRTRLGIARLHLSTTTSDTEDSNNSNLQEAIKHFEIISNETDVVDFPELFDAIGDAFFTLNYAERALDFYMFLTEREETNGSNVWFKIGQCYQLLKDFDQAKECFENVIEEEPENLKVKLSLAKVFEQLGQPKSALNLIKQGEINYPLSPSLSPMYTDSLFYIYSYENSSKSRRK
jgi:general transcription factor 3C polypeptide 3 (transcription factor C subunit 4)